MNAVKWMKKVFHWSDGGAVSAAPAETIAIVGSPDKRTPEQCIRDRCAEYEKARARYTRPAISAQVQRQHGTRS